MGVSTISKLEELAQKHKVVNYTVSEDVTKIEEAVKSKLSEIIKVFDEYKARHTPGPFKIDPDLKTLELRITANGKIVDFFTEYCDKIPIPSGDNRKKPLAIMVSFNDPTEPDTKNIFAVYNPLNQRWDISDGDGILKPWSIDLFKSKLAKILEEIFQ